MQDIKIYVDAILVDDNQEGLAFEVRVEAPNLPDSVILGISNWALSREMSIDMEALESSEWDVSRPEEDDMGVWYIDYSSEA